MKAAKLSKLGKEAEKLLELTLKEMAEDAKKAARSPTTHKSKFTLLDRMKVIDRVGKFEAIRAKLDTPEGSFFSGANSEGDTDGDE